MRLALALAVLVHGAALAAEPASPLAAHGRIEWDAGGLYAATLADGTRLHFALPYPEPAGLPPGAEKLMQGAWWNPREYGGQARAFAPGQQLAVFDADRSGGKLEWTPPRSAQRVTLTLERLVPYRATAFSRPSPEAQAEGSQQPFVFSALYPVFEDAALNDWVREVAGRCDADLSCTNRVTLRCYSPGQISLDAGSWTYGYGAAHENYRSVMRHYLVEDGAPVHTRFGAWVAPTAACRDKVSGLLVARLKDQGASWAEEGALDASREPKFIPLPGGIEFHWDPYEVSSFGHGMLSVFLTRAELGECATKLPRPD